MDSLFWSDQIAKEIVERKKYHYIEKEIKPFKKFVIKTSASISGVLHIGRLSDTIRCESVTKSLIDSGHKAKLIWVAEDMDPLRKVPKGVPAEYANYIGMPVAEIPDHFGCHNSYAEHNKDAYFQVLDKFVSLKMKKFSMREEYKKGKFRPYIKKLLKHVNTIIEIQNKYRTNPLPTGWSPWTPICENCGKIITPRVISFDGNVVHYKCEDYKFETMTAKGCGHEGYNDPLKGEGKLMWKSEWASQWARWKVVSEGAGKEYQVPMSAWWVNGEIVEHVLDFPMPVPIFYEHLLIDGEKMSASKGNVVYPKDWIEVAEPELLKFFYNKRLMKTRSFSWRELPNLYDDYDKHALVYFDKLRIDNEREKNHMKRLYEISQIKKPKFFAQIPFSFAAIISQICKPEESIKNAIKLLKFTGHINRLSQKEKKELQKRLLLAKKWSEKYAPEDIKIKLNEQIPKDFLEKLTINEKNAISMLINELKKELSEAELQSKIYDIARANNIEPKRFFQIMYQLLLNKDSGPRLGPFIMIIGKDKIIKLLEDVNK
ncbi:MAG: lysine--tRNA ligase [Candidatus Aenigmatarchaeota archaeon]